MCLMLAHAYYVSTCVISLSLNLSELTHSQPPLYTLSPQDTYNYTIPIHNRDLNADKIPHSPSLLKYKHFHPTASHSILQYRILFHPTASHSILQYRILFHCIALYPTIAHSILLYHTESFCIAY